MFTLRAAAERGRSNLGWLDSRHTFSFSNYHDPAHMGFGTLRVLNEDRVAPGQGFATHSHRDMEILSWVLEGALEHKDSLGIGAVIRPGELQRMSAGTGVTHSEFNASAVAPVHFLQIWLLPDTQGLAPGYAQRVFTAGELRDQLRPIASGDGREGSVTVHQDVVVYAARLGAGVAVAHVPAAARRVWLQVARGAVEVDGRVFNAGDGLAWVRPARVTLRAREAAEVLLFDLAA
ncbi:MAG: pirin family protein [Rhodanobacteraceae bacterium]|nr:MAG: pirin family protein [Rhodanobacteraceae bacterium]